MMIGVMRICRRISKMVWGKKKEDVSVENIFIRRMGKMKMIDLRDVEVSVIGIVEISMK